MRCLYGLSPEQLERLEGDTICSDFIGREVGRCRQTALGSIIGVRSHWSKVSNKVRFVTRRHSAHPGGAPKPNIGFYLRDQARAVLGVSQYPDSRLSTCVTKGCPPVNPLAFPGRTISALNRTVETERETWLPKIYGDDLMDH